MNIEYIKKLNLEERVDKKEFITYLNGTKNIGMTNFINKTISFFYDDQSINGSFKAYLFFINHLIKLLSFKAENINTDIINYIKSYVEIIYDIALSMDIHTFKFYTNINFVKNFFNDINVDERFKFSFYSWNSIIEEKLTNNNIKILSLGKLVGEESKKVKLMITIYTKVLKNLLK